MSGKWPGGFIKKTAPTVVGPVDGEGGSASGIWTLDQAADYESRGLWPMPVLDAELYTWGNNSTGQLGDGTTTVRSSPVQIGALTTWLQTASGYSHTLATTTDGKLYAWGTNTPYGELGQGNTTNYSSPVQVGALTTWLQVAGGYSHSLAIKTDGTLWSFGRNFRGALGLGNITDYSSPVQVGALTTWSDTSAGAYFSAATKTDGTLWCWGQNTQGQLGDGTSTNRSSPVQVGALTTWSKVVCGNAHTLALKTDGTLWAWGNNSIGQLGQGNTTNYSSPVQVGALTTWSDTAAGNYHSLAIKTDGALWTWGYNVSGQLGLGTSGAGTYRSSPVQVGALTTWSKLAGGRTYSAALKTDGTFWTWGENIYGQLGQGNTTGRSSPVQVGALTSWTAINKGVTGVVNGGITKT
jgi:alpha-tubulin suppressor-like RCC1 family protein